MVVHTQSGLKKKYWLLSLLAGAISGAVVALVMTTLDWRLNASGIFHQEGTTDWSIVLETAFSWFLPIFLLVSSLTWIIVFLFDRKQVF